jgi:hypothetical protein
VRTVGAARAVTVVAWQAAVVRARPADGAVPLVHLHYRGGNNGAAVRARLIGQRLEALAFGVEYVPAQGLVVRADRLRFFHPTDAGTAAEIVFSLDGAPELQDFTHYLPRPALGTLELWLAAEG